MKLILASASPRRIEMFINAGYDPIVMPASVSEEVPFPMTPETTTMFLALKKGEAVRRRIEDKSAITIVAADTVVVCDGEIIGKPEERTDAYRILSNLRGRSHDVITGCCVIEVPPAVSTGGASQNSIALKHCFFEKTIVHFKYYTDDELLEYINTEEPYDKAGGYAIQGTFSNHIDHIEGDFNNVVGLPLSRILPYL
ncbi:MAG: Maf family protein [Lentihominibacter sp.]|jgi:septum formation protein